MKKGDIVILKSGGPKMTIHDIDNWKYIHSSSDYEKDEAKCFWFDGNSQKEGVFSLAALKVVTDDE